MPVLTYVVSKECVVCGTALDGPLGSLFHLFGISRSSHNPNVCSRCDAHLQDGSVVELTVIFADLAGFTAMTNRLGAERSYEIVSAFFAMAGKVLIENDAFIDKYIGDAVMAIFNAPIMSATHARSATTAALGIVDGVNAVSAAQGLDLQARVGVASGYARVGRVGSSDRKDYTAIGDVVNLASRLEALARPGEVILNGAAFTQVQGDYPELIAEMLPVRGFPEPVASYRIRKSDRDQAPSLAIATDVHEVRRHVGLGTILFTIFGAPCAVATALSPLAIVLGFASVISALGPALLALDSALIRIPLQIFAVLGAGTNAYVVTRGQTLGMAIPAELTRGERRKRQAVIGMLVFTLLAVAFELWAHLRGHGMGHVLEKL